MISRSNGELKLRRRSMKILAKTFEGCIAAGLEDGEIHGLAFEAPYKLWAVGGRGQEVSYLVSPDEFPAQMPPRWYRSAAFDPCEITASPYWAVRSPADLVLGYDSMSWDWMVGDAYLVLPQDRLLRLVDVEPEAMQGFTEHAAKASVQEEKWAARARVDAIAGDLKSDEVVEALALIEAKEFALFEQFIEEPELRGGHADGTAGTSG
jgi:hypothetical protein